MTTAWSQALQADQTGVQTGMSSCLHRFHSHLSSGISLARLSQERSPQRSGNDSVV